VTPESARTGVSRRPSRSPRPARAIGNRAGSALVVLAFIGLLRIVCPGPEVRTTWLYLVALPIGYGHLIGGLWFARQRMSERVPGDLAGGLVVAFALVSVANLLAAYTWALHTPALLPWVLVPMLLVSAWHIVENDLALGEAYRCGLELGSARVDTRHNLLALGVTGLIALAALLTPTGAYYASVWVGWPAPALASFTIDELATAVLLYHAVCWVWFFWDRSRRLQRADLEAAGRLRRKLVALHAVPLAGNALLYLLAPSLHLYVAAPTLYLFWSVLHAFQTLWVRSARAPLALRAEA